ncbi:hypothetical protein [Escherichia coli]|uniref:hypothetical protein n=1 Tax=Escherichia coli TaxID=562 RepID=UPI002040FAB6|nr:hypothetical protein [Escherichia coli]
MATTFRTIRFLIFQPEINRWRFFVSITIIFLKGTGGIFTFKEDDCESKSMDGFIYVGVSDGLRRTRYRKISDYHGQRYGRKSKPDYSLRCHPFFR